MSPERDKAFCNYAMARTKDFDEGEVLKKAVRLFWDKGYNGTSMQDLIDGLGISRSSLYDTFGDKHQLYLKALNNYQQGYSQHLCGLIREAPNAKAAIRSLLELIARDLQADDQKKGCFMVNAGIELGNHDAEVNQLLCQNEQALEQAFLKTIKSGQAKNEIDPKKDPQAIARFLSNTVKGMQVSGRSVAEPDFFRDIIDLALAVLG